MSAGWRERIKEEFERHVAREREDDRERRRRIVYFDPHVTEYTQSITEICLNMHIKDAHYRVVRLH